MSDVFALVDAALKTLSPAVPYACGDFQSSGALPDLYLVYQLISGTDVQFGDNQPTELRARVQITILSRTGFASLPDIDIAMAGQGFHFAEARQLPFDPYTLHFCLAKDYFVLINKES